MNTTVAMFTPGENLQRTSAPKAISKPAPLRARPTRRTGEPSLQSLEEIATDAAEFGRLLA